MEILLIRHGQSRNNLIWEQTGGTSGREADSPLTDLGAVQAQALADWFRHDAAAPRITELHTSLMMRAVQTAAPLAEALEVPLLGHPEAFEVGGPYDEDEATGVRSYHPGTPLPELRAVSHRLDHTTADGGDVWWPGPFEVDADVHLRAARVVDGLLGGADSAPERCVALVTHGYFVQFLIRRLLGIAEMTGWIDITNTSISRFRLDERGALALGLNTTPHLAPDQVSA